jgi:O-antigen ligase
VIGILVAVALFVMLSVAADRAASIDRVFDLDAAQDMRTRGLPIVLQMIGAYFPVGTGFGSFDPVFRLHEPFDLLKPSYFNHAHNDFLEIILNGGLPGALLLMGAIAWWAIRSVNAWRGGSTTARLGSATVFLILVASVSDYPLRTPQMMAVLAIAALWMGDRRHPAAA